MRAYSLSNVGDRDLLRNLASLVSRERATTAELIAHIAEVENRRLYLPAGYPSMFEYCVRELHMSEYAALRRIRAGKKAGRFPEILLALAEGRLHLTAVLLLAPHLTRKNAAGLIAAATNKTRAEIELMLAQRFPKADVPAEVKPIEPSPATGPVLVSAEVTEGPRELTTAEIGFANSNAGNALAAQLAPAPVESGMPRAECESVAGDQVARRPPASVGLAPPTPSESGRVKPLSPERFSVQFTMPARMHAKLRQAQDLLSHQIPSGDIAEVFERALDLLVAQLEKHKFAATNRPRSSKRVVRNTRTIPAHVKRAVIARDQRQCTYVGESGTRCPARRFLEFDHIQPVARGGEATEANLRLRCRAHNLYEAEKTFGDGFMHQKRVKARHRLEGDSILGPRGSRFVPAG